MSSFKSFAITFCIAVIVLGIAAFIFVPMVSNSVDFDDDGSTVPSGTAAQPGATTPGGSETSGGTISDNLSQEKSFTVLFIGTDYQPETLHDYDLTDLNNSQNGFPYKERTVEADTIMLVHINKDTKEFVFSQIPLNTLVNVNGGDFRIAELYDMKGVDYLCETVTSLTGLPVDYYFVLSVEKLAPLIDELGGLDFTVPVNMSYTDESQNLKINLKKGTQTLDGDKAMQLLRYKLYSDGNSSRMTVALDFVKALFKKLTAPENFVKSASLFTKCSEYFDSNFSVNNLVDNAPLIFSYPDFKTTDIKYPGKSEIRDGIDYYIPQKQTALTLFKQYKFKVD